MIKTFKDEETEKVFNRRFSRKLPQAIQRPALKKLRILHHSERLEELRIPPANRLEALSGNRAGQHSIRINDQWRVCFIWRLGDAYEVEVADYH